uniref:Reverse transcriptase zinc-binding domain-containing protein n=1 Tax=Cannabis sativa TaxID=3483 RepID=A0A803NIX7_CANSA
MCAPKEKGGTGFKDFELFNKVLLAKQVWHILRNPNSLVGRVLKNNYFSHSNILDAKKGSSASSVWRALLWGREIIVKGARWRVGSGEDIDIVKDRWLPRPLSFKPLINPDIPTNTKVVDLRLANGEWDVEYIRRIFCEDDANLILGIQFGSLEREEYVIWHFSKNGEYNVRSGYTTAMKERITEENSNTKSSERWWKHLWNLRVLPKVKQFLWKLWYIRNLSLHNNFSPKYGDVIEVATNILDEYRRHNGNTKKSHIQQEANMQRWTPPEDGKLIINVDAAIDTSNRSSGVGELFEIILAGVCVHITGFGIIPYLPLWLSLSRNIVGGDDVFLVNNIK